MIAVILAASAAHMVSPEQCFEWSQRYHYVVVELGDAMKAFDYCVRNPKPGNTCATEFRRLINAQLARERTQPNWEEACAKR